MFNVWNLEASYFCAPQLINVSWTGTIVDSECLWETSRVFTVPKEDVDLSESNDSLYIQWTVRNPTDVKWTVVQIGLQNGENWINSYFCPLTIDFSVIFSYERLYIISRIKCLLDCNVSWVFLISMNSHSRHSAKEINLFHRHVNQTRQTLNRYRQKECDYLYKTLSLDVC